LGTVNKRIVFFIIILSLSFLIVKEVNSQGLYVGSKNSDVYHYPSCRYVDNILEENKIWFSSVQDAINHGYRACKVCNPPSSIPDPSPEPVPVPEPEPLPELTGEMISKLVTQVIDGDTFDTSEGYRIRLADIDTPELGHTGYLEATEYLELLIEYRTEILDVDDITGTDPYGRYVCLVYVQHNSTHYLNVNEAMLEEGCADLTDFTNNEFNPTNWNLYRPIDGNTEPVPELTSPIAVFSYSPLNPQVNETITFDPSESNDPDGTIESYFWNFGDGETSTTQTPIHTYLQEGAYSVTLTITDNDGLTNTTTSSIGEIVIPEFSSLLFLVLFALGAIPIIIFKKMRACKILNCFYEESSHKSIKNSS